MKRLGFKTLLIGFALIGLVVALVDYEIYRRYFREEEPFKEKTTEKVAKQKPTPAYEVVQLTSALGEPAPAIGCYKPGHWTAVRIETQAHERDFLGELELTVVDRKGTPQAAAGVPFEFASSRPLALAKEQSKQIAMPLFFPLVTAMGAIDCRGVSRRAGLAFDRRELLTRMPAYQYYWVVLARRPDRYAYLTHLPLLRPLQDTDFLGSTLPLYRIMRYSGDVRPPLPAESLFWTSIAVLLWDDAAPEALEPEQRQALVDWLHWGGQLIVSGPRSLDVLAKSFLGPYLPALADGACELIERDLAPLAAGVSGQLDAKQPWSGVKLRLQPGARFIEGTGTLLAQRPVGRGRVLASAFSLDGRQWIAWPGANAVLRQHGVQFSWTPPRATTELQTVTIPPQQSSRVRYFSRDTGSGDGIYLPPQKVADETLPPVYAEEEQPGTGVAAWNDFNPVAQAARRCLGNAARVKVPDRSFVVAVLAVYLLVLVPLNWLVCRALGRVQWAWAAAPVIAVLCAAAVIRLAELDIGFVRLRTEIAVVEGHAGYPRAHLTRYVALYSSLTTAYGLRFPQDPGALVHPFPKVDAISDYTLQPDEVRRRMHDRRDADTVVDGFLVNSNSTGLLHSEQMRDLGGVVRLTADVAGGWRVENHTPLAIEHAVVTRKISADAVESAWLERVAPGASVAVDFQPFQITKNGALPWSVRRDGAPLTAGHEEQGAINLRRLTTVAEDPHYFEPHEVRLVGLLTAAPAGLEIHPAAAQSRSAGLLILHLGRLGPASERLAGAKPPRP